MTDPERIHCATFIFRPGDYDAEFHRLDQQIAEAARQTPGYLGEESWQDPARGEIVNCYYWSERDGLEQLMAHPVHRQAKARQADWLNGYRVIQSEILQHHGDGKLDSPLPSPFRSTQ